MTDITLHATIRPSEGVLVQTLPDGEIVLLNMGDENYFGLDEVGADIWARLAEGKTLGQVADEVAAEYDATRDVLERDVIELVEQLVQAGLVTTDA